MGALSHYLEQDGIPTSQISLIRLHTEIIKPPRALWVPFELGRPLGAPDNPDFQRQVLLAALKLFEAASGPVLVDFPVEAPVDPCEPTVWACPISLPSAEDGLGDVARLERAFVREVAQMSTWYEAAKEKRGRTTYGVSGLLPREAAEFLAGFLEGEAPANPRPELELPWLLKLVSEDLKAYYQEAITAQPGGQTASRRLTDWFFGETVAGQVFLRLRSLFAASQDPNIQKLGNMLLVPASQASRKAGG